MEPGQRICVGEVPLAVWRPGDYVEPIRDSDQIADYVTRRADQCETAALAPRNRKHAAELRQDATTLRAVAGDIRAGLWRDA